MRCSLSALAFAALWLGCSDPPATPARDAGGDLATADQPVTSPDVTSDAAVRCMSDRECSAQGRVCNAALGVCVECNATRDCTDGRTCLGSRCVAATACTTSRMCPGQVCAMSLGVCVDCERDVDCAGGLVCRSNACVAPPRPCRSSRECSDIGQVCAPVRGHCVDCVLDSDCPMGSYCSAELACLVRACVPNTSTCASATRVRRCNAVGSAAAESDCPAGQTCRGTSCQAPVCAPGQVSCDPMSAERRVCAADGGGYTPMPCASGESCRDGTCVPRNCTPGTATCASMTERRVCATDGLTTAVMACASGEGCRDGACMARTCVPGSAVCASATSRDVCNADGFGTTATPCGASQRCAMGACVDLACTPGSSMCTSATSVRVCSADGTSATTIACPASSTCTGTMCSSWVCAPGTATCPAGTTARNVCSSDGLRTTSEPCGTPANATTPRCGADNACTFTCAAGFGDCNLVAADGCEATLATNLSHCGRCGNPCAPRPNATAACAAGVCDYRCAAGFADCDGNAANGCEASLTSSAHCGRCGNACPAGMSCAGTTCSAEPTFRVEALTATACASVEHAAESGDDRGGIALSRTHVFYTGDTSTIAAPLPSLTGGARAVAPAVIRDGMVHDTATGTVYVLLDSTGREIPALFGSGFTAYQLGVLDGATGALTAARVPLSTPLSLFTGTGIFSGRGRVYLHTGSPTVTWYQIRLPTGAVTTLRTSAPPPMHMSCENWAYWGVAEYFEGDHYAVFAEGNTRIVRYRIRDGVTTTLASVALPGYSDMCSLAVSPTHNRWYFHHEGPGFTGGRDETLGACDAMTSTP